ncbi:unnamed protein product, partial [marine sediment metagenome]
MVKREENQGPGTEIMVCSEEEIRGDLLKDFNPYI